MPTLSKSELRDELRAGQLRPVYVLFGAETYLRNAAAKHIADLAFGEGDMRDFNDDEYSLTRTEALNDALAAAEQMPMMASRRVIRISDVRVAATAQKDTLKEDNEEALSAYLERPSPDTIVIFIADELSGNRKLSKLLLKYAAAVEFKQLFGAELERWAQKEFTTLNSTVDEKALKNLLFLVGPDLNRLSNEIAKLSTASLPGGQVTQSLIDLLVERSNETDHFQLTEHLMAGRSKEALSVLQKILDDGAEPLALLGLIAFNFRKLATTVGRVNPEQLKKAITRTAATDLAIKTSVGGGGPAGSRLQLEQLVLETIMSGQK
ncbi:MAG: DNA polymerase III subunit delta [Acidobacteria bacterium]|nr:DNA polymerase III subunit delta [Acidobacteriota bacterium]